MFGTLQSEACGRLWVTSGTQFQKPLKQPLAQDRPEYHSAFRNTGPRKACMQFAGADIGDLRMILSRSYGNPAFLPLPDYPARLSRDSRMSECAREVFFGGACDPSRRPFGPPQDEGMGAGTAESPPSRGGGNLFGESRLNDVSSPHTRIRTRRP